MRARLKAIREYTNETSTIQRYIREAEKIEIAICSICLGTWLWKFEMEK